MTFIFKTYPQKRRSQFHDHLFTKGKAGMSHRPRLGRVHECDPCHPGSAGGWHGCPLGVGLDGGLAFREKRSHFELPCSQ